MKLAYYKGPNFGDAINEIIFPRLLPGFFDGDSREVFFGIGSTLGFLELDNKTERIIIFSSGFAYGKVPKLTKEHDVRCVRGPLTAKALGISSKYAVTDGAYLLRTLPAYRNDIKKKYRYTYIPHFKSEAMYDRWKDVFNEMDVNFVSPRLDPTDVIEQIRSSEIVLAEAMHAAIFADSFRVPWIPVRMFEHINSFKWKDWLQSVDMVYRPNDIFRMYNMDWLNFVIKDKTGLKEGTYLNKAISKAYRSYQTKFLEEKYRNKIMKLISNATPYLSSDAIIDSRINQLQEILERVERDYMG